MTAAPSLTPMQPLARHARRSADLAGLAAIYEPDVHLTVAHHLPAADAAAFVGEAAAQRLLSGLELLASPARSFADQLMAHAPASARRLATLPGFSAWTHELDQLIELFTLLFDLPAAGVRITSLSQPMCPRFHVDHVPCRLITTQGGVGTEWLPEEQVDRARLSKVDVPVAESLVGQADACIRQLEPWDIGLFRGEGWEAPGAPGGVVHRSPPVPAGSQRLLVTLDFPPGP